MDETDIGASVIARLKNKAKEGRLQLQLLLSLFCQEEVLIRDAKKMMVIDDVQIIEMGNQAELINEKGKYYNMYLGFSTTICQK